MVPVPESRVLEVYAFLAGAAAPGSAATEPVPVAGWDERMLELVLRDVSDTIWDLAQYLAQHPDRDITTDEAAAALRLRFGWNSLAGALGAFGRYLANRNLDFPWDVHYASDGRARMRMDAATATAVRAIGERD
jgi:hypothetical protein